MTTPTLTGATCGEACWKAYEDICRCSCGGVNHACLRSQNGQRPDRTSRVKSHAYILYAVANDYRDGVRIQNTINGAAYDAGVAQPYIGYDGTQHGYYPWRPGDDGVPAVRKTATAAQIKTWPELASFRNKPYNSYDAPSTLWLRLDCQGATWLP